MDWSLSTSNEFLLAFDDPSISSSGRIPTDLTHRKATGLGCHSKQIQKKGSSNTETEVHVIEPKEVIIDLTETSDEEEDKETAASTSKQEEGDALHPHAATFAILAKYKHAFGSEATEASRDENSQTKDKEDEDSNVSKLVTGMGGYSKRKHKR